MRNRELLEALENHAACMKDSMHYPTDLKDLNLKKAEKNFRRVLFRVDPKDITELFADLRDYWDTLNE
jgi:hypothetical protein